MNKGKTILSLCSGSGAWEKPYKDAGYNVISVTLPEMDVLDYVPPNNVYGILAAPPCTMFSLARTRAKKERDLQEGMLTVKACLNIIWECRYKPLYKKDGALKFWVIENPVGFLRQFLGKPAMTFDPYEFGAGYTKKTDLWGYFNEPKKNIIKWTSEDTEKCHNSNRKLPSISDITSSTNADKRAVTPAGFSKAFFNANR